MADFDRSFWEQHWRATIEPEAQNLSANPYLAAETTDLPTRTALDAGCGTGTEAMWLASQNWDVTAADISATALEGARTRAVRAGLDGRIQWVEADLARWEPARSWDLVVTNYAHADIGHAALYERIAGWVAPGGTILIVGHVHGRSREHSVSAHPDGAMASLASVTDLFRSPEWRIVSAYENTRIVRSRSTPVTLRDFVVRADRQS